MHNRNNTKADILQRDVTAKPYVRSLERFYFLLEQQELNTVMLAALLDTGRVHLNQVLNNKPGRGHRTRVKAARLRWPTPHPQAGQYVLTNEMLAELNWSRDGKILPQE